MADTVIEINEEVVEEKRLAVVDLAQRAMHVSLGAADLAREEMVNLYKRTNERFEDAQQSAFNFVEKLIERGRVAEQEGRKTFDKTYTDSRQRVVETVEQTQSGLDARIEKVLHGMNVPTKSDIDALSRKIATLTRKVNALTKAEKARAEKAAS